MNKKNIDNGAIRIINTDVGKIGINTKNGKILSSDCICQSCGTVLKPTDYLDYICNKCNLE